MGNMNGRRERGTWMGCCTPVLLGVGVAPALAVSPALGDETIIQAENALDRLWKLNEASF